MGALLHEEFYAPEMEGVSFKSLLKAGHPFPQWMRDNAKFIGEIQQIHDSVGNWSDNRMPMILELFAAERGLTMPA